MNGPALGLIGFVICIALILARVPVAVSMGVVGAVGYGWVNGWASLAFVLGKAPFDAVFPYDLSVVPLFVMMGVFAGHAGLSRSLYNFVAAFVGHLRGGLALATIGACALFGAICGSSIATAATLGKVALPEMRRLNYRDSLAAASIAAGGTLGVMIPPSIVFVIYGLMTEQSIGKLFISGIFPGVVGMLLYMGAVHWTTWRDPAAGPSGPRVSVAQKLKSLREVWRVALLFTVVLGGMYVGWFSPTEAAAVGAFGAVLLSLMSGHLDRKMLSACMLETTTTSAMIFMIVIGASIFNFFLESTGFTQGAIEYIQGLGWNRWLVMAALMIFYIILGCFLDSVSMILLTIGPVFPLVNALAFDPIWFGVMLVSVAEIGMITPPVGMNLFVLQAVSGLQMQTITRGIMPFVTADCVRLVLLSLFP
ncbi:MAG: C4-dicarboxylate ABC transporter permease, partial [Betaproteobacteria bacterium RIFCSPLOWO2_12_FULL_65_14]